MADGGKVKLDIGCGKNKLAGYTGIDINPNSDADIVASALALPFEDESVDEIYSAHLVEHFDVNEAQKFFDEIYRVLKKGGAAVLKIDRSWSKRRLLKKDPTHKYRFTEGEIKKMVSKFGKVWVKDKIYLINFYTPHKKIFVHLVK